MESIIVHTHTHTHTRIHTSISSAFKCWIHFHAEHIKIFNEALFSDKTSASPNTGAKAGKSLSGYTRGKVNRSVRVHKGIREGTLALAVNMHLMPNTRNSASEFRGCTAVRSWHILSLHLSWNILQMSSWSLPSLPLKPAVTGTLHNSTVMLV